MSLGLGYNSMFRRNRGPSLLTGAVKVAGMAVIFTLTGMAIKRLTGWREPVRYNGNNKNGQPR